MKRAWNFKDIAGQTFGRLTVLEYTRSVNASAWWKCLCACGKEVEIEGYAMRSGHTQSCGCLHSEQLARRNSSHKQATRKKRHPLYSIWKAMKKRCYNSHGEHWKSYGGKGVTVCERWKHSFPNFLADMGERPDGFSLDRIDNGGDYTPDNCRWATWTQQANNRSSNRILEFNGISQNVNAWAISLGVPSQRLRDRLHSGWTVERTLTTPSKNDKT